MSCPLIEIFPTSPFHFIDSDGRVLLDVSESTTITLNQSIEKSGEAGAFVKNPESIVLAIPNTPKNYLYLKDLFDPNGVSNTKYLDVRLQVGSKTFLHDRLYGIDKNNAEIQISIVYQDAWVSLLKATSIADLDLGEIDFSEETLLDKFVNDQQYADGDDGYWFPLVNYGGWRDKGRGVWVEDFRFHIHATFLLQKMFAHIGWCFESPFYETDFGRRLITYLLKSDYNNNEQLKNLRKFFALKILPIGFDQDLLPLTDWVEAQDGGNNFDPVLGIYDSPFQGRFFFTFLTDTDGIYAIDIVRFRVVKRSPGAGTFLGTETPLYDSQFALKSGQLYAFSIEANLLPGDEVFTEMEVTDLSGPGLSNTTRMTWNAEIDKAFYVNGDVITINKELDKGISCFDVFQALQHLINGIVEADVVRKKVTLWTPYDANVFGQSIEGYYDDTLVDLVNTQPRDTSNSSIDQTKLRYARLAFAASSDGLTKSITRPDGSIIFSRTVDFGEEYEADTQDDPNPLFEPTLVRSISGIYRSIELPLPVMTDNDDGEISYDIKPRILYAAGYGEVGNSDELYPFHGNLISNVPWSYQHAEQFTLDGLLQDKKLVYGDETGDLWTMVYGRFYLQFNNRIRISVLSHLRHIDYFGLSLKNAFNIEYDGKPMAGRIIQINSYRPCENITTELILVPETNPSDLCITPTETVPCNNNPFIQVQQNGSCFDFSISGEFDCGIESLLWEYKSSETGNVWVVLGTGSSAQVCDHPVPFIVRVTVGYDCPECPDSVKTKRINPCSNTLQCLITQYINESGQTCLEWGYVGSAQSPFDIEVEMNGDPLDEPYIFCGAEDNTLYTFIATFTFENGCDDLILTCSINTGANPCENEPILICVPISWNGINCMTWILGGVMTSPVQAFIVTYECEDGISGQWQPGDDPICCDGIITANAMVFFCNCPMVCTPTIECEADNGCTMVTTGTPLMIAACN